VRCVLVRRRLVLKLLRLQPRNLGAELAILVRRLRNEGSKLSSRSADWDVAGALVQYCDNRSSGTVARYLVGVACLRRRKRDERSRRAHTHTQAPPHQRRSISVILLLSLFRTHLRRCSPAQPYGGRHLPLIA